MINLGIIKDLCKKMGISVRKLAEILEVKPSSLQSAIDNNSTTLANIEKIANFFNISVGVFFGEKNIDKESLSYFFDFEKDEILRYYKIIDFCGRYKNEEEWNARSVMLFEALKELDKFAIIKCLATIYSADDYDGADIVINLAKSGTIPEGYDTIAEFVSLYKRKKFAEIKEIYDLFPQWDKYKDKDYLAKIWAKSGTK